MAWTRAFNLRREYVLYMAPVGRCIVHRSAGYRRPKGRLPRSLWSLPAGLKAVLLRLKPSRRAPKGALRSLRSHRSA